jgi:hypothetical protein
LDEWFREKGGKRFGKMGVDERKEGTDEESDLQR